MSPHQVGYCSEIFDVIIFLTALNYDIIHVTLHNFKQMIVKNCHVGIWRLYYFKSKSIIMQQYTLSNVHKDVCFSSINGELLSTLQLFGNYLLKKYYISVSNIHVYSAVSNNQTMVNLFSRSTSTRHSVVKTHCFFNIAISLLYLFKIKKKKKIKLSFFYNFHQNCSMFI